MGKHCIGVVILAVLLYVVSVESRVSQADRLKFHEHVTKVNSFTCGEPQQRTVKLQELGISPAEGEHYIPSATVLKRCHCAGYCATSGQDCKPATTTTVEIIFKVVTHVGVETTKFQRYNVTEDNTCSCQT